MPTFEFWLASYRVYRCIVLLIDMAGPEVLDKYGELIRSFVSTYTPECWFLVYLADVRMRSEHFERLRRFAERGEQPPSGVVYAARPWNAVFHMAVADRLWWDDNLHRPAMLYLRSNDRMSLLRTTLRSQAGARLPSRSRSSTAAPKVQEQRKR